MEGELVGPHAERRGEALASPIKQKASLATLPMQSSRVGPARVKGREQSVAGGGVQRAAGGVQHVTTVTPPVPGKFSTMH